MSQYTYSKYSVLLCLERNIEKINQKQLIEGYFRQGKSDLLRKKLQYLLQRIVNSVDLNYPATIEQTTGYPIDIFEYVRKRVDTVLAKNIITRQKE